MADTTWTSTSSTDASLAANYQGGAPATGDTVTLNSIGTANLATNLGYYTNVLGFTLNALATYTGNVGVEATGTNAATYLLPGTSGTMDAYIGRESGNSGNSLALGLIGANGGTLNLHVFKTGSRSGTYPVLCVKGATVNLYAYGGETGFAVRPGEVGTLGTLSLLKQTGQNTGAVVRVGKGAVWPTTVFVEAGTLYSHATNTLTTLKLTGGEGQAFTETDSTGAITGVDIGEGGKFFHRGTGGIAAATVRASSTFSLAQDARDKTLDEVVAYAGATIDLDNGKADSITHSGGGTNVPTIYCVDGIGTVTIKAPAGMSLNIR